MTTTNREAYIKDVMKRYDEAAARDRAKYEASLQAITPARIDLQNAVHAYLTEKGVTTESYIKYAANTLIETLNEVAEYAIAAEEEKARYKKTLEKKGEAEKNAAPKRVKKTLEEFLKEESAAENPDKTENPSPKKTEDSHKLTSSELKEFFDLIEDILM